VRLANSLLVFSAVVLAVTGLAYVVTPGFLLSIVGIDSAPASDFLLRTEGAALLAAAILVWSARDGQPPHVRVALLGLAVYYVLSSIVDLSGFVQNVVGPVSVPSAVLRIGIGGLCAFAALKLSRSAAGSRAPTND
jgi:hypothetical protein